MRILLVLVLFWPAHALAQAGGDADSPSPATDSDQVKIAIPLTDGRVSMQQLLRALCDVAEIDPPPGLDRMDWTVDPTSRLGRWQLRALSGWTNGAVSGQLEDDAYVITVQLRSLDRVRAAFDGPLIEWIRRFSGGKKDGSARFGITFFLGDSREVAMRDVEVMPAHVVLLVHGLDDPGWMWEDLLPLLFEAGYAVAKFEYPNDGSIDASVDLLAEQLIEARRRGMQRVSMIGKSMGGLVARDVLTRKEHYNGDGTGGDRFPAVVRLIMVGTPNHGSYMVRFRYVTEFADHAAKLFSGRFMESLKQLDGRGEAGDQLLPGSPFLAELNARAVPRSTHYTIIAGRRSPIDEAEMQRFMESIRLLGQAEDAPPWLKRWFTAPDADGIEERMRAVVRGLGDGVVTLDSARLDGVADYVEVEANHFTLIRNFVSESVPAAIPIILDRLQRDREAAAMESEAKP